MYLTIYSIQLLCALARADFAICITCTLRALLCLALWLAILLIMRVARSLHGGDYKYNNNADSQEGRDCVHGVHPGQVVCVSHPDCAGAMYHDSAAWCNEVALFRVAGHDLAAFALQLIATPAQHAGCYDTVLTIEL